MSNAKKKRVSFRPSVTETRLEQRLVLSSGTGVTAVANPAVVQVIPSPVYAELDLTPPPAAPPVSAAVARARAAHKLTIRQLRADYTKQVRAAARDLRSAIKADIAQLYAGGATPTAQQLADFKAGAAGAVNATALRLSTQASLLPNSTRLVSAVQNEVLGSGAGSLASRLVSLAQSGKLSGSTAASSRALARTFNTASQQTISQINHYFNTTPVNRLSVNSSGQRIPLEQYLGGQLLNQVGNTLGSLAQSFPNVANAMLFPNGTTGTPTQAAMNAFTTQYDNALATAAYQLGSGLSLFPGSSSLVSQIQPILFGATNAGTGTALTSTTNPSLAAALNNLQYGTVGFNTALSNAFGNAFQGLASPLGSFFGMTGPSNMVLPTSGFTSLFGSPFTGSSFFNGFNSGFATGTTPGFIGFGVAPTGFNTNFGTGFNGSVSTFNQNLGFALSNPVTGTSTGIGISQSNPVTGTSTGTGISQSNLVTGTSTGTGVGQTNPVTGVGTGTTGTGTGLT